MIHADLVVTGIRELATLSTGPIPRVGSAMSDLGRLDGAALAIDAGRFAWVGPERRLRREVRRRSTGRTLDLGDACVVPGFVDAHTHVLFAGDRANEVEQKVRGASYREIAEKGGGLFSTVRATRSATGPALRRLATDRLRRMLEGGTTVAEVKSGYDLTHAGELRLLELIPALARSSGVETVATFLGAHAVPPEYSGRADAYIDQLIARTLPEVARRRLARFCDVFCEPGFFTVEQSERLLRAAIALGLGVKIHADEFVASGGAELAARLGARSADHLLVAPAPDRQRLADAGVTAVLLPVTPFASLAGLRSPGREMVDAGVPVALGTDLSPNSWVESMALVLAHAVYSARLTPAEAITAATVNAAHAIGVSEGAGVIAEGRPADFSAWATASLEGIAYRIGSFPTLVSRQGIVVSSR
jgi:imidazolonepropionase